MKRITAGFVLLFLAGCESTFDYNASLAANKDNAKPFNELSYLAANFEKRESFQLGKNETSLQVATFPWGSGFVLPIELPDYENNYEVIVRSRIAGKALCAPAIWFLDENYNFVGGVNSESFRFSLNNYIGNIFVNDAQASFKYMLVFSDSALQGADLDSQMVSHMMTPITVPINGIMVTWNYQSASAEKIAIKHTEGGVIELEFKQYAPITLDQI